MFGQNEGSRSLYLRGIPLGGGGGGRGKGGGGV